MEWNLATFERQALVSFDFYLCLLLDCVNLIASFENNIET